MSQNRHCAVAFFGTRNGNNFPLEVFGGDF